MRFVKIFTITFLAAASLFFLPVATLAGAPSIYTTPTSGSHLIGEEFTVSLIVSANGEKNISTFGADVSTTNLTVIGIAKQSGLLWTKDPTVGSLGFYGGITGSMGTTATNIYTLTVKGIAAGAATLAISNGNGIYTDMTSYVAPTTSASYTITQPVAAVVAPNASTSPVAPKTATKAPVAAVKVVPVDTNTVVTTTEPITKSGPKAIDSKAPEKSPSSTSSRNNLILIISCILIFSAAVVGYYFYNTKAKNRTK